MQVECILVKSKNRGQFVVWLKLFQTKQFWKTLYPGNKCPAGGRGKMAKRCRWFERLCRCSAGADTGKSFGGSRFRNVDALANQPANNALRSWLPRRDSPRLRHESRAKRRALLTPNWGCASLRPKWERHWHLGTMVRIYGSSLRPRGLVNPLWSDPPGMGATTVPVASGAGEPSSRLASLSRRQPSLLVGSPFRPCFGLNGLAGLYQTDLQVPADTQDGDLTRLAITRGFRGVQ